MLSPEMKIFSPRRRGGAEESRGKKAENWLAIDGLNLSLGSRPVLHEVSLALPTGITMLIGPSGAGKSSLLRCINRLHDDWQGSITVAGTQVRHWQGGADGLRRSIGLIGQQPALFPCSIGDNVLFGLRRQARRKVASDWVEQCLRRAALWHEVEHRLHDPAATLSVGQQQRLCLARALALSPQALLLDEPTSALDPRSTERIEQALVELATTMPLLCVSHDTEQARRLADMVVFICNGRVIEQGAELLDQPQRLETREYLRWSVCDCD
ncbi:MAG: ATP-binding cassette domain-containing protein [Mariprofundales bacterium]